MKKIIKIQLYILFMLSGLISQVNGQHLYNGSLSFPAELVQQNDSMYLTMTVNVNNMTLGRNQSLSFTPVLVGEGRQAEYPSLMINGRVRQKALRRAEALDEDTRSYLQKYYVITEAGNSYSRTMTYRAAVPYEDWMRGARVDLIQDMSGCGKSSELVLENIIGFSPLVYDWDAIPAYIKPQAEAIKVRDDRFEVYLEFVVAKTDILPDFRNNRAELNTLEAGLNTIQNDANLQVTRLAITGYASPEGSVDLNNRLSEGRANAMSDYLAGRYRFPRNVYQVEKGGEDWAKLEQLVAESSGLSAKDEILNIIRTTPDVTERQARLTRLQGGAPYRQLLNEYYPQLRRVLCVVNYTVKDFSVEEAKAIIKTNPRQLSLDEMYRVAQTYPQGSDEYKEVFDIAVRTFPSDPVANMNVAAVALSRGDLETAKRYMDRSDKNSAEYYNNQGILYLNDEDFDKAEDSFRRAAQMGSDTGRRNLELLQNRASTSVRSN
ncbi:MAG: DUF3868 domain-containing protein [Tannerellaceae bacterium]|nr:DUF3868 domain-containing protein [Tannerellaceae bacterium]